MGLRDGPGRGAIMLSEKDRELRDEPWRYLSLEVGTEPSEVFRRGSHKDPGKSPAWAPLLKASAECLKKEEVVILLECCREIG